MTTKTQSREARPKTAATAGTGSAQSTAPVFDTESFAHLNDRNLETAMRMGQAMFDSAASMNQEILGFVSRRLEEDMRTAQTLCDCRHPAEFVEIEMRFMQTLVQHYAENASRLLGIASDMLRSEVQDVEEAVTELTKTAAGEAA